MRSLYGTLRWQQARRQVLARDRSCIPGRLFGGQCRGTLHIHHIVRPQDGGDPYDTRNLVAVCAAHHPQLEAMRRYMQQQRPPRWRRCPHAHPTAEGRRQCEERLNSAATA
jgi:hypothetical protein